MNCRVSSLRVVENDSQKPVRPKRPRMTVGSWRKPAWPDGHDPGPGGVTSTEERQAEQARRSRALSVLSRSALRASGEKQNPNLRPGFR